MEPLLSFLTRCASRSDKLPLVVTVARKRPAQLCGNIFGKYLAACLVVEGSQRAKLILPDKARSPLRDLPQRLSVASAIASLRAGDFQVMLRFVEPEMARQVLAECPMLTDIAQAIVLDWPQSEVAHITSTALLHKGFAKEYLEGTAKEKIAVCYKSTTIPPQPNIDNPTQRGCMRTLVILDNSLTGERGHNLSVAQNITRAAIELGIRVVWAANRRLPGSTPPDDVFLERCFAQANYDAQAAGGSVADLSHEILQGWQSLIEKYDAPDTHYLIHSATGHHFRAAERLLWDAPVSGVIHLCTFYETANMPARLLDREIDRQIFLLTRNSLFGERLFLWAETDILAQIYSRRFKADILSLPLPVPDWASPGASKEESRLTLAFLGAARREKGFLELPSIVRAVLDEPRLTGRVKFTLQASPPIKGMSPEIEDALKELKTLPGVEIIPDALDDARYRDVLRNSDIILLPYRPQNYAARGSGILIEALACGKICLVSDETALASYDSDAPVIACKTPADWAAAIHSVLTERDEYRRRTVEYAALFRLKQSGKTYIQRLMSPDDHPAR